MKNSSVSSSLDNAAITALVKSMKRALAKNHHIEVPHSALRASLLQALGENPHAFAKKVARSAEPVSSVSVQTWYLVGDDLGCLTRLALDPQGLLMLPQAPHHCFSKVRVVRQEAQVPRVSRYGLPDYLSDASTFYADQFGLELAVGYTQSYVDLGDDSGDSCQVTVALDAASQEHVWSAVLAESGSFIEELAEWVGLHYRQNFFALSPAQQKEWFDRWVELHSGQGDVTQSAPQPSGEKVVFEWVWPDEDADSVQARVDLATGAVTLQQAVPADITHSSVRTRIWVRDCPDDDLEVGTGQDFSVYFSTQEGAEGWKLSKSSLDQFKAFLKERDE